MLKVVYRGADLSRTAGLLLALASGGAFGQDLIIESNPAGKNHTHYREILGKWMDSRIPPSMAKSPAPGLTAPGACGSRKTVFSGPNVETSAPATARFFPLFQEPGRYHVYVTWPRAANASSVRYVIRHAHGSAERVVDQNGWGYPPGECNAGVWVPLGEYDFAAGEDQYVEVRSDPDVRELDPRWYGQVYADAVRFTREPLADLGTPLPPEAPPAPQGRELPLQLQREPLPWEPDLDSAWRRARAEKKNLLVYFFQADSEGALAIEEKLFARPEIHAALQARFVLVRLNHAMYRDLAQKLGVFRANLMNLYRSDGEAVAQLTHESTPEEFLDVLRRM